MQRYDFKVNLRKLNADFRFRSPVGKITFIYNNKERGECSLQIPNLHPPLCSREKKDDDDDYFDSYRNIFKNFGVGNPEDKYPGIHLKIEQSEANPPKVILIITGNLDKALELLERDNYITREVRREIHEHEAFKDYCKSLPYEVVTPASLTLTVEDLKRFAIWEAEKAKEAELPKETPNGSHSSSKSIPKEKPSGSHFPPKATK